MKTAIRPDLKQQTSCISKSYTPLIERKTSLVDFKFYQKLFVLFVSLSTILIFSESPRELANICESNNSKNTCNVW
tara:strand:- start:113 stop:340 length:228 start_codon:yes stop_codon:yes gene_type:complete